MARTKAEVTAFLNSQVGLSVNAKCGVYRGQCVSLIKALMEYLGVPDPYAARGNAKDVGDTLLRQNIAENGKGQITVVVNRSMGNIGGVVYGHIWLDIPGVANYEQNGARALHTTKNTRPLSQGQQFVNLDKWIKKEEEDFVIEVQRPVFKPSYYASMNPDLAKNGVKTSAQLKAHWLKYGIKEGRRSAPNFHVKEYIANYSDLTRVFGTKKNYLGAVRHYFTNGINEGRLGVKKKVAPAPPATVNKAVVVDYINKNLT